MQALLFSSIAAAVLVKAHQVPLNDPGSVIFTYQTFVNEKVETTTTTLPLQSSTRHPGHAASSYTFDPKDNAYPTFANVFGPLATESPAPGLPDTAKIVEDVWSLILQGKTASPENCLACQQILSKLSARMKFQQETLRNIAIPYCTSLKIALPMPICMGLLRIASTDISGIFPAMDMMGEDGQTLCAFMFGSCTLPAPPELNLAVLFKGMSTKPAPRTMNPCKKEPLKVLHVSDYHKDFRYVVGAEADCDDALCCRVMPYTNVSAPVKQPASLFGNYLCDTPELLGTSVFRNVPKVSGFEWSEFSFGIFTGDLVSHDLWELTESYVMAEILGSYQHFFDGLGGVKIYPTLGNHDTFPQAFTSYPNLNDVLPFNASYTVQEEPLYQKIASAWKNYGWLNASEAQGIVSSGLGIYRAVTAEGLVIISLNSDIWYYFNLYAYIGANKIDTTGTFRILIDYLLEAESENEAVWLIQHVHVGGSVDFEALPAASDLYYQIIDRFNNTIRGIFFGHTHEDEFGVFYANNASVQTAESAVGVGYIMPSVTSHMNLNAGFRYYLVDPDTFDIIDSVTFYANISNTKDWESNGEVEWEFEYSARETYDPTGTLLAPNAPLTPAFWHQATEEISNNKTMFEIYTDLRKKKYRPYSPVTGDARNLTLCGLRSLTVPIFERCLGTMSSPTNFL